MKKAKKVVVKKKKRAAKLRLPKQNIREVKWYGWRPDMPDHRDHRLYFGPNVDSYPPQDFLPVEWLPPIRDQGNQGSCTGHGVRSLGQYMRKKEGQVDIELSPRFIYYNARVVEHTVKEDAGAEIRDCIKQVAHLGFASEKDCPYDWRNWTKRPSNRSFVDARQDMAIEYARPDQSLLSLKSLIAENFGFVFGFAVYENFESRQVEDSGIMNMPQGYLLGGHAVWAVGYDDSKRAFLIGNSWGTDWGASHPNGGSRGYFWMPYDYITNNDLCDDFWVIRKIS